MTDNDIKWILDGLKKPGKTKTGLAMAIGRTSPVVSSILKGERPLKAREVPIIARYLGVETPGGTTDLIQLEDQIVPVRVQGKVDAGSFRAVEEFDDVVEEWINEPRDPDFPQARQIAFDVAGDSMNKLRPRPILPGDRIICLVFDDLGDRVPLRDKMVVVVEQTLNGGQLRERSVKQIALFNDRVEFQPRSSNPAHKPIVVSRDLQADDGRTVAILAIVRSVRNEIPLSFD